MTVVTGIALFSMFRSGLFAPAEQTEVSSYFRAAPRDPGPVVIVLNYPPDEAECAEILTDDGHGRPMDLKQYEKKPVPVVQVQAISPEKIRQRRLFLQNQAEEKARLRIATDELQKMEQRSKEREERHRKAMEREKELLTNYGKKP